MALSRHIHRAERESMDSLHRGAERARSGAKELGAKMRQGLQAVKQHLPISFHAEEQEDPAPQVRQGIVSINGQDVGTVRCTGGKKSV